MNSLDLFSGIGGISLALGEYARTIGYVEIDKYAQSVLLSRMVDGSIEPAPIFRDITRLDGTKLRGSVDIICGGFPCQDISVAGSGKGLAGERSGLFYEIVRLTKEIRPSFVFLENVPAIRTRGLEQVIKAFTEVGYDCRWTMLTAASVGANHKRERWFLLAAKRERITANTNSFGVSDRKQKQQGQSLQANTEGSCEKRENYDVAHSYGIRKLSKQKEHERACNSGEGVVPNTSGKRLEGQRKESSRNESKLNHACDNSWWAVEPSVGRVDNGIQNRVDRIKCLGNSVVPLQVKTAFERLIGEYNTITAP